MNARTFVGLCSICGGSVSIPSAYAGPLAPTATCDDCKAVRRVDYGPFAVIPMMPAPGVTLHVANAKPVAGPGGSKGGES